MSLALTSRMPLGVTFLSGLSIGLPSNQGFSSGKGHPTPRRAVGSSPTPSWEIASSFISSRPWPLYRPPCDSGILKVVDRGAGEDWGSASSLVVKKGSAPEPLWKTTCQPSLTEVWTPCSRLRISPFLPPSVQIRPPRKLQNSLRPQGFASSRSECLSPISPTTLDLTALDWVPDTHCVERPQGFVFFGDIPRD